MGFGSVWVLNNSGNSISRIDPRTDRVTATIAVGQDPCLCIGLEAIWIPTCKDKSLSQIDPKTDTVARTTPIEIAGEGGFWLFTNREETDSGSLSNISPQTGKVVADLTITAKYCATMVSSGSI